MPPKKLTAEEQAFVDRWSQKMFYFVKMMRRADLYIRTIPRESYKAAHAEYANSGAVAIGEWENRRREGKKPNWQPKREDREAYVDYMQELIESHPLISPINNQDLEHTKEERHGRKPFTVSSGNDNAIDPGEGSGSHPDDEDIPFTRTRPSPIEKIPPGAWKRFEAIGETYFVKDTENDTDFIAFELTGISICKRRKSYQIRFEDSIDSIQLTEEEFLGLIEEGLWV
ncbi:hypothetical protein Clacol_002058 [Clathrus columnatus]|uniref:Uncharacterized protein n=1 Tax=Clathrus columnatus TaxID=1419009 RepID=A0AAV5A2L0_9AGAM|nr:hypothetical protein Clacol_002058 [Clathrus columnatus]